MRQRFMVYRNGEYCCLFGLLLVILLASSLFNPATAEPADSSLYPHIKSFFPYLDHIGPFEGKPRAAAVYGRHDLLGYVFLTSDVMPVPAYSGKPISTLVGFDTHGTIVGVRVVKHQEPILVIGISDNQLDHFVNQYRGINARDRIQIGSENRPGYQTIDAISGATITVMVINTTVSRALQLVAESRGILSSQTDTSITPATMDEKSLWRSAWAEKSFQISVLGSALVLLLLILLFQDWLVRRPVLLAYVRDTYLVFTVVFIGWYALAQLSVLNVFTFIQALTHEFQWQTFLVDPLMFILWGFVALLLVLWGRGVYCGWLCPFGAAQELINQIARRLNIRQWEFPLVVHERLWALKYIILLMLFGLSLQSLETAEHYSEIEPFKTAFTLRFQREWSYLFYAVTLLLVSVVNRKFYCKYLCPLGAALAIPARLRLFDWLRRRKECGHPCSICEQECEVRAISATGEINVNECHYCLDCQVSFYNKRKCPPLVKQQRKWNKQSQSHSEVVTLNMLVNEVVEKQNVSESELKTSEPHTKK